MKYKSIILTTKLKCRKQIP